MGEKIKSRIGKFTAAEKVLAVIDIITFIILEIYIFTGSLEHFSSDSAGYSILAREQYLSGSLFPDGWRTSTGIFGFSYNLIIAFLSGFMKDQLVMRSIAVTVYYIFLIATLIFLSVKVFRSRAYLAIIPFISIGMSSAYGAYNDMMFCQAAYLLSVIVTFLLPAVFLVSLTDELKIRPVNAAVFAVVYSLFAFTSISVVQQAGVPLMVAVILFIIIRTYDKKITELKKYLHLFALFGVLFVAVIGNMAFYVLYMEPTYLSAGNFAYTTTAFLSPDRILSNIETFIHSVLYLVGFDFGKNIMSLEGIITLFKCACAVMLFGYFPVKLTKKYKELSPKIQLFVLYGWVHSIEVIIIVLFGSAADYLAGSRYMITTVCVLMGMSGYYIHKYVLRELNIYALLSLCVTAAYVFFCGMPIVKSSLFYDRLLPVKKSVTDYLKENGLTFGYSTFWNAGCNTVLSDFDVQINPLMITEQSIDPHLWLCADRYFNPEIYSGKSFLMLSKDEENYLEYESVRKLGEPTETVRYNDYIILVYDRNISLNGYEEGGEYQRYEKISFGSEGNNGGLLKQGWFSPEEWGVWSDGGDNTLAVDLSEDITGDITVDMEMFSFSHPRDVEMYINGHKLGDYVITTESGKYSVIIPEEYYVTESNGVRDCVLEIRFVHKADLSPSDISPDSIDERKIGIGLVEMAIKR